MKKLISYYAIFIALLFLCSSFLYVDFNPKNWDYTFRLFLSFFLIIGVGIITLFYDFKND